MPTSAAFMRPLQPDAALSKIVGCDPLPRTEVTKKIWQYIKSNKLQSPLNKRNIDADDNLLPVFNGRRTVSMFELTKLVGCHLSK
jgi:chromatin remodeling complex protein RSC6